MKNNRRVAECIFFSTSSFSRLCRAAFFGAALALALAGFLLARGLGLAFAARHFPASILRLRATASALVGEVISWSLGHVICSIQLRGVSTRGTFLHHIIRDECGRTIVKILRKEQLEYVTCGWFVFVSQDCKQSN